MFPVELELMFNFTLIVRGLTLSYNHVFVSFEKKSLFLTNGVEL